MATANDLKKRINDEKLEMIDAMDVDDLSNFIMSISHDYYIYFMNEDISNFNAAASILNYIRKKSKHNNISNYINYCMLVAVNTLLNRLMDRKMDLIIPDVVDITATADNEVIVNLLERVKAKRKELNDLTENPETTYGIMDKQLELTDADKEADYNENIK